MEWQPIETAPKDFTPVLLWWIFPIGKPGIQLARWTCWTHAHSSKWHAECPNGQDCRAAWLYNTAGFPTHWMPLPAAPRDEPRRP